MKKIAFMAIAAIVALASCMQEPLAIDNPAGDLISLPETITAMIGPDETKTALYFEGEVAKITWDTWDMIVLNFDDGSKAWYRYYWSPEIIPTKAVFKFSYGKMFHDWGDHFVATYGNAPSPGKPQAYAGDAHAALYMTAEDYLYNIDNLLFTAKCGVLKLNLTDATHTVMKIAVSSGARSYYLSFSAPQLINEGRDFYISLPAGTYDKIQIFDGDCNVAEKNVSLEIQTNHVLPAKSAALTFTKIENVLTGVFSVSASKAVRFSQGNLYANGSAWGFEANQYDFRTVETSPACINGEMGSESDPTQTPASNRGLFQWATGSAYALAPEADGETNYDKTDVLFTNADASVLGPGWEALSESEWHYLLYGRRDAAQKYGFGQVHGVPGLILLPDDCVAPGFTPAGENSTYADNDWDNDTWTAMEAAGVVFLPAAGHTGSTFEVSEVGATGAYWSSTPDYNKAFGLKFSAGAIDECRTNSSAASAVTRRRRPTAQSGSMTGGPYESVGPDDTGFIGNIPGIEIPDLPGDIPLPYQPGIELPDVPTYDPNNPNYPNLPNLPDNPLDTTPAENPTSTLARNLSFSIRLVTECEKVTKSLDGAFSVSATKSVSFAPGNLFLDDQGWGFEANQYDYRTRPGLKAVLNGNIAETGDETCGLFLWRYDPSAASCLESVSYNYGRDLFADHNPSVMGTSWFTLTRDEWHYLLYERTDAATKVGLATVCGVYGLILVPDNYTYPGFNPIGEGSTYADNQLANDAAWKAKEVEGCVFLPAAGYAEYEAEFDNIGSVGAYWSGTTIGGTYAFHIRFWPEGLAEDWTKNTLPNLPPLGPDIPLPGDLPLPGDITFNGPTSAASSAVPAARDAAVASSSARDAAAPAASSSRGKRPTEYIEETIYADHCYISSTSWHAIRLVRLAAD